MLLAKRSQLQVVWKTFYFFDSWQILRTGIFISTELAQPPSRIGIFNGINLIYEINGNIIYDRNKTRAYSWQSAQRLIFMFSKYYYFCFFSTTLHYHFITLSLCMTILFDLPNKSNWNNNMRSFINWWYNNYACGK